jgi:hypothetical protein
MSSIISIYFFSTHPVLNMDETIMVSGGWSACLWVLTRVWLHEIVSYLSTVSQNTGEWSHQLESTHVYLSVNLGLRESCHHFNVDVVSYYGEGLWQCLYETWEHGKSRCYGRDQYRLTTWVHIPKNVDIFLCSRVMCYKILTCDLGLINIRVLEISLELVMSRCFRFGNHTDMASTREIGKYFIPSTVMLECPINTSSRFMTTSHIRLYRFGNFCCVEEWCRHSHIVIRIKNSVVEEL